MATLSDGEGLRDSDTDIVQPQARHHMETHARLKNRFISLAQTGRSFTDRGRIANSDGITEPRLFLEAVSGERLPKEGIDLRACATGANTLESRIQSFDRDVRELTVGGGRLSDRDRAT